MRGIVGLAVLAGCGAAEGDWSVETWGEEYIEQGIPADAFADGCSVVFDTFEVAYTQRQLVDGDGTVVGDLGGPEVFELVTSGPTPLGAVAVPADHYSTVVVTVAPHDGPSVAAAGTLTCGGGSKAFSWTFDESTTYVCEPEELTIPAGGADRSQITVHGDHLFYDGLENPDAAVRGRALFDADADGDGQITLEELDAVDIPSLGYAVGQFSEVLTLRQFVAHLTRTLVHIDGEGHCGVDL